MRAKQLVRQQLTGAVLKYMTIRELRDLGVQGRMGTVDLHNRMYIAVPWLPLCLLLKPQAVLLQQMLLTGQEIL